ncbi:MAG: AAA family ATPase [Acidimicrobiales bacterium]
MLHERDDAIGALTTALQRVTESGAGKVAVVSGEAGVGKTSLLREFTGGVGPAQVLWGPDPAPSHGSAARHRGRHPR